MPHFYRLVVASKLSKRPTRRVLVLGYWFEREHSPDLAFLIARRLRSLFRWLIGGLRWSLTVEKAGDVGEARMNRAWSAMDTAAKPSARLRAADPDQNGDVEITLAGIVQRRSQVDHATAWDGTI